ncbi:helix-turn-helix transcriptional regulator [Thiocapsa sp.]|nr:helix-turn-helix transcriptional regulator [Thiocapsa sp.]
MAETSGTTRQMLSMVENGKANPSADLLARLARALDCDMDDLHGESARC